jgi:hypothetical protein
MRAGSVASERTAVDCVQAASSNFWRPLKMMNDDEISKTMRSIWDGLGLIFSLGISKLEPPAASLICRGIEAKDLLVEFRIVDGSLTCKIKRAEEIVYQFSVETEPQKFRWADVPVDSPVH